MSFVAHLTSESKKEEYKKNLQQRMERSRRAMRVVLDYGEEAAEAFYANIDEDWFSPENATSSAESLEVAVIDALCCVASS